MRFDGIQIADDLAAESGGHGAEFGGGNFGEFQGAEQSGRENGFAGFLVELDGDFDYCSGVDAQLAVDVAVNRKAVTAVARWNHGAAKRDGFDGTLNGNARGTRAESLRGFAGNIDKADDADFVNFSGEDARSGSHGLRE